MLPVTSGIHQGRRRRVGLAHIAPTLHLGRRPTVHDHIGCGIDPQQQIVGENMRWQHGDRERATGIQRQRALIDFNRAAGEVRRRHSQTPLAKLTQRPRYHHRIRLGHNTGHQCFHGSAVSHRGQLRPRCPRYRAHENRNHSAPCISSNWYHHSSPLRCCTLLPGPHHTPLYATHLFLSSQTAHYSRVSEGFALRS